MRKSGFLMDLRISYFQKGKVLLMNNGNQFLGTERIGTLMRQYAVPCIISLLDGVLYSMPVSDILTFVLSAVIIVKTCRRELAPDAQTA